MAILDERGNFFLKILRDARKDARQREHVVAVPGENRPVRYIHSNTSPYGTRQFC